MKALVLGATGAIGKDLTDQLVGDVLFSALGTTIKAAGSQDAQWKVDYTYQYNAARALRSSPARTS